MNKKVTLLKELKINQLAKINKIEGRKEIKQKLFSLGIISGIKIKVESKSFGSIVIKLSGSRVALCKNTIACIWVDSHE